MSIESAPNSREPLAIIGAWCRLPGASSPKEYWDLLIRGGDATAELPNEILDRSLYYSPQKAVTGRSYSTVGGLVEPLPFDNSKCRLSDELIAKLDRSHLTICEVAADAIRDAGLDPFGMPMPGVGVYIGHTGGTARASELTYAMGLEQTTPYLRDVETIVELQRRGLLTEAMRDAIGAKIASDVRQLYECRSDRVPDKDYGPSNAAKVISAAFGLQGPALVVDAACASSLQALALAARALDQRSIDMAIVGGASCCKGDSLILFSAAQSVSSTKSRPFDADASGLITSEGYVSLVVKRLSDAVADGDRIHCVIRSLGVSADGKGKSLWAPLEKGQKLAIARAYREGLSRDRVQYIEAHATSTQVGDATELSALGQAFVSVDRKIPLGSAKANVGHTLETAGLAGLLKAMLSMQHGQIPPVANLRTPNPSIDWNRFHLPLRPEPWPQTDASLPRVAAVNAFGIGGLNVHVVLEEHVPCGLAPTSAAGERSMDRTRPVATVVKSQSRAQPPRDREPVAVIGMGCVLPGAHNVNDFWELLESGRDPKSDVTPDRWDPRLATDLPPDLDEDYRKLYRSPQLRGGFCSDYQYDWRKHRVPPKQIAAANPLQFMMLDAADQALRDSGILATGDERARERVGVVVGSTFGDDFSIQLQMGLRIPDYVRRLEQELLAQGIRDFDPQRLADDYQRLLLSRMPALVDETGSFTSSTLASRITKTFDLNGGAAAIDAGSATGLVALESCIDILRDGECDAMVCAAGQRGMDPSCFIALERGGLLASPNSGVTFDETCDGLLPGEGCCVVVLKRLSDAERDGDKIHAVIRDVASVTATDDTAAAYQQSFATSLDRAAVSAAELCLVEGTAGTPISEQWEVAAIERELTAHSGSTFDTPLPIHSLVSQFGHLGAAHSLASVMKVCLAIERGHATATFVPTSPRQAVFANTHVQPQHRTVAIDGKQPTSAVAVICGAKLGTVSTAILEPAGRPSRPVEHRASSIATQLGGNASGDTEHFARPATASGISAAKIVPLGGSSWQELTRAALQHDVESLWRSAQPLGSNDRLRAAFVSDSAGNLAEQLRRLGDQTSFPDAKQVSQWAAEGIFVGQYQGPRPCVFAFPGQGSQYPGMFAELFRQLPAAGEELRQADAALQLMSLPDFQTIAGSDAKTLGQDLGQTQASMLVSSWVLQRLLRRLGLEPAATFGHSFGEYAAIAAAGGWSITDALRAAQLRARSVAESPQIQGGMLATDASLDQLRSAIPELDQTIFLANVNGANQLVLAGQSQVIDSVASRLRGNRHVAIRLAVSCPFHTPLMQPASEKFTHGLGEIPIADPTIPVISTASLGWMSTAAQIRSSLIGQLTSPVRFPQLMSEVAHLNPALVVEVGPKQVLTRLAGREQRHDETIWMESDRRGRGGELGLLDVIAQALCVGCLTDASLDSPDSSLAQAFTINSSAKSSEELETMTAARGTRQPGTITVFDATEPRRARMRSQAQAKSQPSAQPNLSGSIPAEIDTTREPVVQLDRLHAPASVLAPTSSGIVTADRPHPGAEREHPSHQLATRSQLSPGPGEIENLLVDFVVEQTGYPEEIIELDADLESDLGIDSIKKAQLFGELAAQFDLVPQPGMSLDDFPTLNHIKSYLLAELQGDVTVKIGSPALGQRTAPIADRPESSQPSTNGKHGMHDVHQPLTNDALPVPQPTGLAERNREGLPGPSREELIAKLIDFVVEQTGYPEDIIELDADLESDLGIDSIKKAQLFGELAGQYDLVPQEGMSLDDFPTLGHVLEFLIDELQGQASDTAMRAGDDGRNTTQSPAPSRLSYQPANGQIREAGHASAQEEPALAATVTTALLDETPGGTVDAAAIRRQLVDFVIEQTGYPEEIIEFDADLESDLGIDSIKKAQLFGELAMVYDLVPHEGMSLDDFPTLGHIAAFVADELTGVANLEPTDSGPASEFVPTSLQSFESEGREGSTPNQEQSDAYLRGLAFGRQHRERICAQVDTMVDAFTTPPPPNPGDLAATSGDEMAGIAEATSINVEAVAALSRTWIGCDSLISEEGSLRNRRMVDALCLTVHNGETSASDSLPQRAYVVGHAYGHFAVPMGVSLATGLGISCQPLDERPHPADIATVSRFGREVLASDADAACVVDQLRQLRLDADWQFAVSDRTVSIPKIVTATATGEILTSTLSSHAPLLWWHRSIDRQRGRLMLRGPSGDQEAVMEFTMLPSRPSETSASSAATTTTTTSSAPASTVVTPASTESAPAIMDRYVMGMVHRPLANPHGGQLGRVLLVGDGTRCDQIASSLVDRGAQVEQISRASFADQAVADPSRLPDWIVLADALDCESPTLAVPQSADRDGERICDVMSDVLEGCRQAFEVAGHDRQLGLVALTRMGGDFGFTAGAEHYLGGGYSGLFKAIRREYPASRFKVLDFDHTATSKQTVQHLVDEIHADEPELEVGFPNGARHVVGAVIEAAREPVQVTPGGTWLISGGGRGVTHVVARELAKRFGLRLHLIGTTPLADRNAVWRGLDDQGLKQLRKQVAIEARAQGQSPANAWNRIKRQIELDANLQRLAEAGIAAEYHVCDLACGNDVLQLVDDIRHRDGRIHGVIHGAGIESACRFTRKSPDSVRRTIASKCDGAVHLIRATAADELEHFVGFGSTSGRFGGLGQTDYSLASDLLAKLIGTGRRARPATNWVAIHWPAWDEVGMAVRPESRLELERLGVRFMPTAEGVAHLVAELTRPSANTEVLIVHPPGALDSDATVSRVPEPIVDRRVDSAVDVGRPTTQSNELLGAMLKTGSDRYEVPFQLRPQTDPFLVDHRTGRGPVLPAVVAMELFARAGSQARPGERWIGFNNVEFENSLVLADGADYRGKITVTDADSELRCHLSGPRLANGSKVASGQRDITYMAGSVCFGDVPELAPVIPGEPIMGWVPFLYPDEAPITHGPSMQSFRELDFVHGGGRARINGGGNGDALDPAALPSMIPIACLDGCLVACAVFAYFMLDRQKILPYGMESYRQRRLPDPAEQCLERFYYTGSNQVGPAFDFTLVGEAGDVVLQATGVRFAVLKDEI